MATGNINAQLAARATAATGLATGTEGLFAAITSRGNVTNDVTGVNPATD